MRVLYGRTRSCSYSCGEAVSGGQGIGRERTADDIVGVGIAGNLVFVTGVEVAQNVGDDGIHVLRSREVVGIILIQKTTISIVLMTNLMVIY